VKSPTCARTPTIPSTTRTTASDICARALVFGFIATIVAAHKGLTATGGPKGVADAVNQAVVLSVILLAMANVAITQAYVMLVPQGIA
jgi:phospholipid/cholesterol/gamma-HCH transport system permease protein